MKNMPNTVSQTEFNRNFNKYEKIIKTDPVIVYKNNKPSFVAVPIEFYANAINEEQKIIETAIKRYINIKQGKDKTIAFKDGDLVKLAI